MKKKYEAYAIGSKVWAISTYMEEGKKDSHHYAIFPAIVETVYINENGIDYWLRTPKGRSWGDSVSSDKVSDSFEVLTNKLKKVWIKHSEWD